MSSEINTASKIVSSTGDSTDSNVQTTDSIVFPPVNSSKNTRHSQKEKKKPVEEEEVEVCTDFSESINLELEETRIQVKQENIQVIV